MAIIIDTNCLANVFCKNSKDHEEFKPVLTWIVEGKGMMVLGGTKYNEELKKTAKFLTIIRYLKEIGKVHKGNKRDIDNYQIIVEELRDNQDFDDPHLPAIVKVTKCRIICSTDTRSIPYVTNKRYYPSGISTPVYYTSSRNKDILNDKYIDDSLKPLCKLNKHYKDKFKEKLNHI